MGYRWYKNRLVNDDEYNQIRDEENLFIFALIYYLLKILLRIFLALLTTYISGAVLVIVYTLKTPNEISSIPNILFYMTCSLGLSAFFIKKRFLVSIIVVLFIIGAVIAVMADENFVMYNFAYETSSEWVFRLIMPVLVIAKDFFS